MTEKDWQLLEIQAKSHLKNKQEVVNFYVLVNKKEFEKLSSDQQKQLLTNDLNKVNLEKAFIITTTSPVYQLTDPSFLKEEFDCNTIIEATLPYCLHVPNNYDFDINYKGKEHVANVRLQKIWTTSTVDSDYADYLAENKTTYFKDTVLTGPQFPINESLGWQQHWTGKNIEKERDANGTFRYTKVIIQIDTDFKIEEINKNISSVINTISEISLEVINKLLDVYRYVTQEDYVERLGSLNINNVYFVDHNNHLYISSLGYGIGDAIMNRPLNMLKTIELMLKNDEMPLLYELLLLDGASSISKKAYTLAVVKIFQAFEIFLENFLFSAYIKKGLSPEDVQAILNRKWNTKDRIKDLVFEVSEKKLSKESAILWNGWCTNYDKIRNEVIHRGKELNNQDAIETLKINKEIISWLKSVEIKSANDFISKYLNRDNSLKRYFKKLIRRLFKAY
ncbi:MAG: hypothetical protein WCO10_01255 [bacterium]